MVWLGDRKNGEHERRLNVSAAKLRKLSRDVSKKREEKRRIESAGRQRRRGGLSYECLLI